MATQVLSILGEQVALAETGLAPGDSILVPFEENYVPEGFTEAQKTQLKSGLQKLFKVALKSGEPLPPCDAVEKDLVNKSLKHRFNLLRANLMNNKRDSQAFRVTAEHAFRLKEYIDFYETSTECSDSGKDSGLTRIEPLDDERIKALIRQFVFLLLQGENPLEDYKNVDPSPKSFVSRLEDNKLDDFDKYIGEYRGKDLPIPPRLAKLLEVADLDLDAIKKLIDDGVKAKILVIVKKIKEHIKDPNDPIWFGVDMNDPSALFDRLLERIKLLEDELKKKDETIAGLENQVRACEEGGKAKDEEIKDLKARLAALEAELDASKTNASRRNTNSGALQKAHDEAGLEIARLKGVITQLQEDYRILIARIPTLEGEIKRLREQIDRLQGIIDGMKGPSGPVEDTAALKEELARVKAQLAEKIATITTSDGERDALKKKLIEKEDEMKKAVKKLNDQINNLLDSAISNLDKDLEAEENLKKLIDELTSIKARLKTLEDKIQKSGYKNIDEITASLEEESNKIPTLTEEIAKLKSELSTAKETISNLLGQMKATENGGDRLQQSLTDAQNTLDAKENELTAVSSERDRLTAELASKTSNSEQKNSTIAGLRAQLQALEANNASLTLEKDTLQKKAASDSEYKGLLQKRVKELSDELAKKIAYIKGREEYILAVEKSRNAAENLLLEDAKEKYDAALAELKGKYDLSEKARRTLQENLDKLKAEYAKLKAACSSDKETLASQISEIAALKEEAIASKAKIDELEAKVLELSTGSGDKNAEIEAAKTILAEAQEARSKLQSEYDALAAEKAAGDEKLQESEASLASATQETESAKEEVTRLQEELESAKVTFDEAEESRSALLNEFNELKAEKDGIDARLAELLKTNEELEATIERLQAALRTKADEYEGLKEEKDGVIATLEESIRKCNESGSVDKEKIAALEAELAGVQAEVDSLKTKATTGEATAAELARIQAELEAVKNEKDEYAKLVETLTGRVEELDSAGQSKEQELEDLKAQHAAELQAKEEELQGKQQELDLAGQSKEQELADLKAQHAAELQEKEGELEEKQQEIDFAEKACDDTIENMKAQHDAKMKKMARDLAIWVAHPILPSPVEKTETFYPVIDAVLEQLNKQRNTVSPTSPEAKLEASTRHCYMLFFAAHTISVHFPQAHEKSMNAEKIRMTDFLNSILYGVQLGEIYTVKGILYDISQAAGSTNRFPERTLMDALIQILDKMQKIYNGNKRGIYNFKYPTFPVELISQIEKKVRQVCEKKKMSVTDFQRESGLYMNTRLGVSSKHLDSLSFKIQGESGSIIFKEDKPSDTVGYMSFMNKEAFETMVDSEDILVRVRINDEITKTMNDAVLTFPICFYLFLFSMKEYLNKIEGELGLCPIPSILKKQQSLSPKARR